MRIASLDSPLLMSALSLRVATFSVREPATSKLQVLIHADIGTGYSSGQPPGGVDVLTGITKAAGAGITILHAEGVRITEGEPNWWQDTVTPAEPVKNRARIAEAGNVPAIMDKCLKVEHARYVGRMHWLGFNTGRITSVRGGLQ